MNFSDKFKNMFHVESYGFQNFVFYFLVLFVSFLLIRWLILRPLSKSIKQLDRDSMKKVKWLYIQKFWWPWLVFVFPAITLADFVICKNETLLKFLPQAAWFIISITLLVLSVIAHLTLMAISTMTVLRQKAINQNPS